MNPSFLRYRSRSIASSVIGFSISYQKQNLLSRGLGLEHLRELLLRLARPFLRQGACLSFGGNWRETEDNFTYDLLRLIRAEQEDSSLAEADAGPPIGLLYNHVGWPAYLDITPHIEAQWVTSCKIVRITQQMAGIATADIASDAEAQEKTPRALLNAAVTMSAMRRLMMTPLTIPIPDVSRAEHIPPVVARILLAGAVDSYSQGFLPGLFEEALVTIKARRPLYILGGFGGAAEVLAHAMLEPRGERPPQFDAKWHRERNPHIAALLTAAKGRPLPPGILATQAALNAVFKQVGLARQSLANTLNTGLSDAETRELMTTSDIATAVRLVRTGLTKQNKLPSLAA